MKLVFNESARGPIHSIFDIVGTFRAVHQSKNCGDGGGGGVDRTERAALCDTCDISELGISTLGTYDVDLRS